MTSDLEAVFASGSSIGSVCVTIENLNDTVIEDAEDYIVTFNSTDEAVIITDNMVRVNIIDESTGEC